MSQPSPALFEITDLHASSEDGSHILNGVNMTINEGEVHALMGPNGSGKSTLASVLLGSPEYTVTGGSIQFRGEDITDWSAEMRGKSGIFLAFQYPHEVAGVSVINFLRQALSARKDMQMSVLELRLSIMEWLERLNMDSSFAERYLNEGFSGGGLDIDALGVVADGVAKVREKNSDLGVLTITHYQRLLEYLNPDLVHVIMDGRIVATGGNEIVEKLESSGYESFRNGDS